jgi:hypothetical protein
VVVVDVDAVDSALDRGTRGNEGVDADLDKELCDLFGYPAVLDSAVDIEELLAFESVRVLGRGCRAFARGVAPVSPGVGVGEATSRW